MIKLIDKKLIVSFIIIVYLLSIVILTPYYYLNSNSVFSFLGVFATAFSLSSLIISVLCIKWQSIWNKYPLLSEKLFPNLNGNWEIKIEYVDKESKKTKNILGECQIHQNIFNLSISIQTETSESETLSISAEKDPITGYIKLHYIYRNDVIKQYYHDNPDIYLGTAILQIRNDSNKLNGKYFTSRNSNGHFSISRISNENSN
ncbi:hypothetical protein [Morganella morganii]|uniref:Cap15 family cyclic dinucleotide receptor domain-containing protein n=1 Tax=Morganella morganii TaxID=582 RepID=UPI002367E9C9|nr:hypothetical protein [Morganella morganii]